MRIPLICSRIRSWMNAHICPPSKEEKKKALGQLSALATGSAENNAPDARALLAALKEIAPSGSFVIPQPPVSCLAFQGGGARGVSYSGVSRAVEEKGVTSQVHTVSGSSAGAITAFLFSMGCNAEQFEAMTHKLDLQDLLDLEGSYEGVLWNSYVYPGKNFHNWAKMVCQEMLGSSEATFGDLYAAISDDKHPYHHSELKHLLVTGTQLLKDNTAKTTVFSSKDPKTWKIKIADAVRASMSIPGLFQPWEVIDTDGNNWGLFFDGGILLNFPINVLDKHEYAEACTGIQYPLVEFEEKPLTFHLNPCSMGFTFVDELSRLDEEITPLTPHLKDLCATKEITFDDRTPSIPSNSIGPIQVGQLIHYALHGQMIREQIGQKTKRYQGNIVQLFSEGVGMMDFAVTKERMNRAALTSKESTLLQLERKKKDESYQGKKPKIVDLKLDRYLEVLALEIHSSENDINQEAFKQNRTIQFLAQKIISTLSSLQEKTKYDYEPDDSILAIKIAKFQQRRQSLQNRDKRLQNILNDEKIIKRLQSYMEQPSREKDRQFMTHFVGNVTGVIELSFVLSQEGRTLLQEAIHTGNVSLLKEMLQVVDESYKLRNKQKKPPKIGQTFHDLINRAGGGLLQALCRAPLDQKQKLHIFDVLLERTDCNPLEEDQDGITALHWAVRATTEEKEKTLFYRLMERASGGYFYRRTYSSGVDCKESLFEYILRTTNPEFVVKILDNETTRRKLFYYKHVCENGFSMQELLADYSRKHPENNVWKRFYDKDLVNDDYQVQLAAFDEKVSLHQQKQSASTSL